MKLTSYYSLFLLYIVFFLTACGGGGGDSAKTVSISLNKSSVSFSASRNAALPATQQVVANFVGEGVLAGVPTGDVMPGWLTVEYAAPPTATTTTFNVSITTSNLAAGTHTTTLRFLTGSTETNESEYKDLTVSYTLTDELSVQETVLNFETVLGNVNNIAAQTLNISGENINWTMTADQSWVKLDTSGGVGVAAIPVSFDSTGMSAGQHSATITVTNVANSYSETVAVILDIKEPAFDLSQNSIVFSGINGKAISTTDINIALNNGMATGWSVVSSESWLTLSAASGTTPQSLTLGVDAQTNSLTSGTHNATLTFNTTVSGNPVTKIVDITLTLTPMTFNTLPSPISVSGINGSDLGATVISFALDTDVYDHGWTLSSNNHWLLVDSLSSINGTNSGTASVVVDASIAPALVSGDWSGSLMLVAQVNGDTITETINVSLSLTQATLTLSQAAVTFEGINGSDLGSQTLDLSINTGNVTHPWTLTMDSGTNLSWMQSDTVSGQLDNSATTVTMTTDETGLLGNVYPGSATATVQVNGDTITQTIPVNLRLDPQKLFVADNGVLLSSFPSVTLSQFSHSVSVTDNAAQGVAWSASDDAGWLNVTVSGTTNLDTLQLTADPAGLATDTLHTATVSITSADAKIENTETVTVGFYVSSLDPVNNVSLTLTEPDKASGIVADPVRPYVYVSHGGTSIDIYNVYTGTLVTTLSSVGTDLRALTISSDGTSLYAMDHSDDSIVPINLSTQLAGTKFSGLYFPGCVSCATQWLYNVIDYTRINSYPVLITSGNQIIDAANGTVLGSLTNPDNLSFSSPYAPIIQASANGKIAAAQSVGGSPFSVARYALNYSALETGTFSAVMTHRATGSGAARDLDIDETGSKIYMASGSGCGVLASYNFCIYSGADLSFLGELTAGNYPVAIEISADKNIYGAVESNSFDVKQYNTSNAITATYTSVPDSIYDRQLALSGGGVMMITRSKGTGTSVNSLNFTLVKP